MRHTQLHTFGLVHSFNSFSVLPCVIQHDALSQQYEQTNDLSVDQFYSQEHNLINGHIDTSPNMLSNASAASHMFPSPAERSLPSDMSDEDIHKSVISKYTQSLAETSKLSALRPNELDFTETLESTENN